MAYRDKTQGFAFAYVDIQKLLSQKSPEKEPTLPTDNIVPLAKEQDAENTKPAEKSPSVEQVKQNLDRLQALHHKLHAILDELNRSTKHSKKK